MSPIFPRYATTEMMEMDMSSSTSTSTSTSTSMTMTMIFSNSHTTPIFTTTFTPTTKAQYAGICIFLIALAVIGRLLIAGKAKMEAIWEDREYQRRYITIAGKNGMAEELSKQDSAQNSVLSANGIEQHVRVVERKGPISRPFRRSVDPLRALFDLIIAGVGYLLMLAVMTMNIGYFCSVLAGIFLGTLLVGRHINTSSHDH